MTRYHLHSWLSLSLFNLLKLWIGDTYCSSFMFFRCVQCACLFGQMLSIWCVARMIARVVRTRVSEGSQWRDTTYTRDWAFHCWICWSCEWVILVVVLSCSFFVFRVHVCLAKCWAFGVWRGWLQELFGLEFPRVANDAIPLTLVTEPFTVESVEVVNWWYLL